METSARLPIANKEDAPTLVIECLPDRTSIGERPLLESDNTDSSRPQVQLVEGVEYRYFLENVPAGPIEFAKSEFFNPDTREGHTGRLRTGFHTGLVSTEVHCAGSQLGQVSFEIQSIRLNYQDDYRRMLRGLAEEMSELVMQRFGPSEQTFVLDPTTDAKTLYQRFAFLKSRLLSESFQSSLERVTRHPYRSWQQEKIIQEPGRGARASGAFVRQMSKSGPRVDWPGSPSHAPDSMPRQFETSRSIESLDNAPNRFVRYCLEHWRQVVARLRDRLTEKRSTAPVQRGISEANTTLERLDELLARPIFREVGRMQRFPASNETLQKRPAYRDVLEAYIEFEVAANLSWKGGRDAFGAGQRDVATLYEYWVFLEFAQLISDYCEEPFEFSNLLEVDDSELNIRLEKGETQVLDATASRNGCKVRLQLWFNRSFRQSQASPGTWTKEMRPDISLKIEVEDSASDGSAVWLHFDAKYRVEGLDDLFDSPDEQDELTDLPDANTSAKRADVLKMHAYRDAIRKSAGAYVIYPGVQAQGKELEQFREFHELLPGLGAFPFRPTSYGNATGTDLLREFFGGLLDHMTTPTTDHDRGRYWVDESYATCERQQPPTPAQSLDPRPAADTTFLLVQTPSQRRFRDIIENTRYPISADSNDEFDRGLTMTDYAVFAGPDNDQLEFGKVASTVSMNANNDGLSIVLDFELLSTPPWPELEEMDAGDVFFLKSRLAPEDPVESPLLITGHELLAGRK